MGIRALLFVLSGWLTLLGAPASAAEVAVLDFDGYGVAFDDVVFASQGFRDAVLEEGSLSPLDEFDLSNRMSSGMESQLSEARRMFSQARQNLDKGATSTARRTLLEVITLHEEAGSPIVRRPEMADVHYFTGVALLREGRSTEAREHFREALILYPGYMDNRAPQMSSSERSNLERAASELALEDRRVMETGDTQTIANRLGAAYIVVGYIDSNGTLMARMVQDGQIVTDLQQTVTDLPPYPGDPVYGDMVREMLTAAGRTPSPSAILPTPTTSTYSPPTDDGFDEFTEIPDFGDLSAGSDPTQSEETAEDSESSGRDRGSRRGWRLKDDQVGEISKAKGTPKATGPVTTRWWFWTATGVVVIGGGTAAVLLLTDNTTETTEMIESESSLYTVTVEAER